MEITEEELEEQIAELRREMEEAEQEREPCHHLMTNGVECGDFHSCCHSCTWG